MKLGLLPGSLSGSGGPNTYVTGIVRALAQTGPSVDVRILFQGASQVKPGARHERARIARLLGPPGRVTVRGRPVSPRLYQHVHRRLLPSYDVVFGKHDVYHQTHLDTDPPVPGSKLVLTLHDLIAERWPDEGRLLADAERLLTRAAAVITVSATSRQVILSRFPSLSPARVHVVWNGVDHGSFRHEPDAGDRRHLHSLGISGPFLLYVGGLTQRKNVDVLVQGYRLLRARGDDVPPLVLVGPWNRDRMALHEDVGNGVLPLGVVPGAAMPALMRQATALVLPSREEGFGLPLLEAQGCGTLVVCSDIPAFREIGGDAALYVDSSSPTALSQGLGAALSLSPEELARRSESGVRHAGTFSWQRSAEEHMQVYVAVVKRSLA